MPRLSTTRTAMPSRRRIWLKSIPAPPQASRTLWPCGAHAWACGPAVRVVEQRNFFALAVWRQVDFPVQHGAVFGFEVHKLRCGQTVRPKIVGLPQRLAAGYTSLAGAAERHAGRRG